MKRVLLLVLTNILIMASISIILALMGGGSYLSSSGLNYGSLLLTCVIFGFTGSFISLLLSKTIAKWTMGVQIIKQPRNQNEKWLLDLVYTYSQQMGIKMPEFGIFHGEPNAFATGPTKNNALIAVSDGLLSSMNQEQIAAVVCHELAHVANGDMVTLTLIQGMVNSFTMFLSRVISFAIDRVILKNEREGLAYYVLVFVFDILFGILGSIVVMWYSRQREYRADAGSASAMQTPQPMINALKTLNAFKNGTTLAPSMQAMGIREGKKFLNMFSTHPSIEQRIAHLESLK